MRKTLLILVVLLVLAQLALQFPAIRSWVTQTDEWEGVPYEQG